MPSVPFVSRKRPMPLHRIVLLLTSRKHGSDYRLLVRRTGNQPPLHKVEWNIHEIARRIYAMQCARATIIQRRMRGIIGRSFIRDYRRERSRLYAIHTAAALKVQRAYRAWEGRKAGRAQKLGVLRQRLLDEYLDSRRTKRERDVGF